ncbi:MAG: hypothetical protein AAF518_12405 [Spirochaetota bacterium]
MDTSEKTRKKIEITDLQHLEQMTQELLLLVQESFSLAAVEISNWPRKYTWRKQSLCYEFIFSQMGSFTVRLSQEHSIRKNPPPIFYLSVGKYSEEKFIWEDGTQRALDPDTLHATILEMIEIYEKETESIPR